VLACRADGDGYRDVVCGRYALKKSLVESIVHCIVNISSCLKIGHEWLAFMGLGRGCVLGIGVLVVT
jgi:hypothetical protein